MANKRHNLNYGVQYIVNSDIRVHAITQTDLYKIDCNT